MTPIVIYGTGATGTAIWLELQQLKKPVTAFCVDRSFINNSHHHGLPVVAYEDLAILFPADGYQLIVGVGYPKKGCLRIEKFDELLEFGYDFANCISKWANVWKTEQIGTGTTICAGCFVDPSARIGENVFIGPNSLIPHDCIIEDHVFISGGVSLSGTVRVGKGSFLGTGSTFRNDISIGENTIIGAGAVMLQDAKENSVYVAKQAEKLNLSRSSLNME